MGLLAAILKLVASRKLAASHKLDENIRKAEAGDPAAQYRLGFNYSEGKGVPQDYVEAAKWWGKAAEQEYSTAQLGLGFLLKEGQGIKQDLIEAYKWTYLARLNPSGWMEREACIQQLNRLRALMTLDQIAEGQKLVSQIVPPLDLK